MEFSYEQKAEYLEQAADLLDTQGWCQGTFAVDSDGVMAPNLIKPPDDAKFCILGALRHVTGFWGTYQNGMYKSPEASSRDGTYEIENELMVALRAAKFSSSEIAVWNDAEERTHGDVTDLLRGVAKDLRNRG